MLLMAMIGTLAALQEVPPPAMGPALPAETPTRAPELDVAQQAVHCEAQQDGEIVVCASRDADAYRLRPLPEEAVTDGPPRAEMMIGDVKAAAVAESAEMPRGEISKRAMIRFTLPF